MTPVLDFLERNVFCQYFLKTLNWILLIIYLKEETFCFCSFMILCSWKIHFSLFKTKKYWIIKIFKVLKYVIFAINKFEATLRIIIFIIKSVQCRDLKKS